MKGHLYSDYTMLDSMEVPGEDGGENFFMFRIASQMQIHSMDIKTHWMTSETMLECAKRKPHAFQELKYLIWRHLHNYICHGCSWSDFDRTFTQENVLGILSIEDWLNYKFEQAELKD